MTTLATSLSDFSAINLKSNANSATYATDTDMGVVSVSYGTIILKWILRLACISVIIVCPWANYQLIQFFKKRPFYDQSSAKWYIIFKAIFDAIYICVSVPLVFFLTFNIDIIHRTLFFCKFITYTHYLADDIISMMIISISIDRVMRITCGYRIRERFSLAVCTVIIMFFIVLNVHHIIRLQHQNGICHRTYLGILDYDFDIYYSLIYAIITWIIILIASINLIVSVYCDVVRRRAILKEKKIQKQQETISKILLNDDDPMDFDNDRIKLIYTPDENESSTAITIEQTNTTDSTTETEQQDNADVQITICVIIISAIFVVCNMPNFILFFMRFVSTSAIFTTTYFLICLAVLPLFFAHTIPYFIFNHVAARFTANQSS